MEYKSFAQVPFEFIISPYINSTQFRILSLIILFNFQDKQINSKILGSYLSVGQDTIRKEINKLKNIFDEHFKDVIRIEITKGGFNQPDQFDFYFDYLKRYNHLQINSEISYSEIQTIEKFLTTSKYFKNYKANYLYKITHCLDSMELFKGIIHTDTRKKQIKNPVGYLITCYKDGKFKYEIATENLKQIHPSKQTIDQNYIYEIPEYEFNILKSTKGEDFKFKFIIENNRVLIIQAWYKNKPANIFNALSKFIPKSEIIILTKD